MLHARWFLLLLLVPIVFLVRVTWRAYQGEQEAYAKHVAVVEELASLEAREKKIGAYVAEFDDPRGREAELRLRYDVAKEGERVVVLIDDTKKEGTNTPSLVEQKEKTSWWQFWR